MKEISLLTSTLIKLMEPIVKDLGYEFYYLEFLKEEGENFLRVYIDCEEGISLEDCEKVSRRISDVLDEEDPIDVSYFLEVSSPGIFKALFTEEHLKKSIGCNVKVDLSTLVNGKKKYIGILVHLNENEIIIKTSEGSINIDRNNINQVCLEGEL